MSSRRTRAGATIGTRLNDIKRQISDQESAARGTTSDVASLEDVQARLETVESANYRIQQGGEVAPQILGQGRQVTDWNDATQVGFYWSTASALNNPVGNIAVGHVLSYGPDGTYDRKIQEVWFPSTTSSNMIKTWRRVSATGTSGWTPWAAIDLTPVGVPDASETVKGIVELATSSETLSGTDNTRATTPAGVKAVADTKAALSHTHTASQITDFSTAVPAAVPAASQTVQGKIELATDAEVQSGTDTVRAVTPAGLSSRTPTSTRTGVARLATTGEATFITAGVPVPDDIIMSPQRVREAINMFAPVVDMGQNSMHVSDWNTVRATGFYDSSTFQVTNMPPVGPGVAGFVGIVTNTSTSRDQSGDMGQIFQQVWEIVGTMGDSVYGKMWTRVGVDDFPNTSGWSPWVSNQATDTRPGEVELATVAETTTGTDSTRATTPAGVKAVADTKAGVVHTHTTSQITDRATAIPALIPVASETVEGKIELATAAEASAGTDATRAVTPLRLKPLLDAKAPTVHTHTMSQVTDASTAIPAAVPVATETVQGKSELATVAEVLAGTDTTRVVTPAGAKALGDTKAAVVHTHTMSQITDASTAIPAAVPAATQTVQGKIEIATNAEVQAGTDAVRAITPAGLSSRTPTTTRTGLARLATTGEATFVTAGVPVPEDIIMSPQRVREAINMFAPAVAMGQNTIHVSNWNDVRATGFYDSGTFQVSNLPPVSSGVYGFVGTVSNTSTSADHSGDMGQIFQQVWEIVGLMGDSVYGRMWTRVGVADFPNTSGWTPWVSNQATVSRAGEVELATSAETLTGSDSTRATTPAGVKAVADTKANTVHTHTTSQITDGATAIPALIPVATETVQGKSELATAAEVQAGTDNTRVVTPLGLNGRTATETRTGLVELATTAETTTGTDTVRAVTPAGLSSRTATESRTGIAELATQAEVNAGTDTSRIVTPATLAAWPGGGAGGPTVYHQGTAAQRDLKFGVPGATVAAQVALANTRPVWFNTELGWSEAYYARTGSSGLTVPGVPPVPGSDAGWYPTGTGPMVFLNGGNTGTVASGRTIYDKWTTVGVIRRGGPEWLTPTATGVTINKAGNYRIRMSMSFPTGTASGVYGVEAKSTGIVVRDRIEKPVTLISSSSQMHDFEVHYVQLLAGDTVYGVSLSGAWTTGSGTSGGARLFVEYIAPPLPSY